MSTLVNRFSGLFCQLLNEVDVAAAEYAAHPKSILTESDLQCILYRRFSNRLQGGDYPNLSVHSEISFLDKTLEGGGKLIWKPDLVVIDHQELDINKGSELYTRKGFAFWGSCLAFELKFNRNKKIQACWKEWKKDIDKLAAIRTEHYDNTPEEFHGAFVLFSRIEIPAAIKTELGEYGASKSIEVKCHYTPSDGT